MGTIRLPHLAWHGGDEGVYKLPDRWQLEICNMTGYDQLAMTPAEIRHALENPIGAKPIKELAKGKQHVVVLFDDMSRITRTFDIVPHVLQDLAEAGIADENIRFVCATGCHGPLTRLDFVKKLGEDVLRRFPVYNHNPFNNCISIGKTKTFGTEVSINAEVIKCDMKIAIGGIVPHGMSGFGGGGKIILPGVGHFGQMMRALDELGLRQALIGKARSGVPFLGICLGLQAMFETSAEAPGERGLALFAGRVERFPLTARVPHMGWNELEVKPGSRLVHDLPGRAFVYFAHSYYVPVNDLAAATCTYAAPYTAALEAGNIFGVQFHPEKSGPVGLKIVKNFVEL